MICIGWTLVPIFSPAMLLRAVFNCRGTIMPALVTWRLGLVMEERSRIAISDLNLVTCYIIKPQHHLFCRACIPEEFPRLQAPGPVAKNTRANNIKRNGC